MTMLPLARIAAREIAGFETFTGDDANRLGSAGFDDACKTALEGLGLPNYLAGGGTPWGWHRIGDFLTCERKFKHRYVARLVPVEPAWPLQVGAGLHLFLAIHYDPIEPVRSWREDPMWPGLLAEAIRGHGGSNEVLTEVLRLYSAYLERCKAQGDPLRAIGEVLAVEYLCEDASADPTPYTCRVDAVLWTKQHGIVIVDHKSGARRDRRATEDWPMHGGILGQLRTPPRDPGFRAAFRCRKGGLDRLVITLITKVKEPQIEPLTFVIPSSARRAFEQDLAWYEFARRQCEYTGVWPRRRANCEQFMRRCDYWNLCLYGKPLGLRKAGPDEVL